MPANLKNFLNKFSSGSDPALAASFRKDPTAAMNSAHVSQAHQQLILSGNSKALSSALRSNVGTTSADSDTVVVIVFPGLPQGIN